MILKLRTLRRILCDAEKAALGGKENLNSEGLKLILKQEQKWKMADASSFRRVISETFPKLIGIFTHI